MNDIEVTILFALFSYLINYMNYFEYNLYPIFLFINLTGIYYIVKFVIYKKIHIDINIGIRYGD